MDGAKPTTYLSPMPAKSLLYDRDFHAWTLEQAEILRARKLDEADIEHIAEEIESLGRAEQGELIGASRVLLVHLLKWRHLPEKRGPSSEARIRVLRNRVEDRLADNPSLKPALPKALAAAYIATLRSRRPRRWGCCGRSSPRRAHGWSTRSWTAHFGRIETCLSSWGLRG
jgi:hypothetical protein